MKPQSVCIIIENDKRDVLLMLRDDIPMIQYPNHWVTFGGQVEQGETPQQAIVRELEEELELSMDCPALIRTYDWPEKREYVFYMRREIIDNPLHEGQRYQYFSRDEIKRMTLAFHDNQIVEDFFKTRYG